MKLRSIRLENVKSFLDPEELELDGDISILIGPNGGGKTNLLDTIVGAVRRYVMLSWIRRPSPIDSNPTREEFQQNDMLQNVTFEKHSDAPTRDQVISLTMEVTQRDLDNIQRIRDAAPALERHRTEKGFAGPGMPDASLWLGSVPSLGERVTLTIRNGGLQPTVEKDRVFSEYLRWYEMISSLGADLALPALSLPVLSLPVRRSSSGFSTTVALPNFQEADYRRSVDAANSRVDSNLAALATGKLADRYRSLLSEHPAQAKEIFYAEDSVTKLTAALKSLGYGWELVEVSARGNVYDIKLSKQGTAFLASNASSGEKEILTYLFAVYALNIRDALVVIDEPELHLHPRWQVALMGLFEQLSVETGNQFVMATHSPSFVSPSTVGYISRVYSENQRSRIIRLDSVQLPDRKHLFSIVNSLNSERIFFSDVVILVEGISDRIFVERLLRHFSSEPLGRVFEVVSVGGKGLFRPYLGLLAACNIRAMVVADRDFANNVGTETVKSLFAPDGVSLKNDVIENHRSRDGASLLAALDEAITTGNKELLTDLWSYIKARRSSNIESMTPDQEKVLFDFIESKYADGVFILKRGSLESYLPPGHSDKDVERLIRLTSSDTFWSDLPEAGKPELELITRRLLAG